MPHEREIEAAIKARRQKERLPRDVEARRRVMRDIALGRISLSGAGSSPGAPPAADLPTLQQRGLTGQFGRAVGPKPAPTQPAPTAPAPAPIQPSPQFRRAVSGLTATAPSAAPPTTGIQAKTLEGPRLGTEQQATAAPAVVDTSGTLARRREIFHEGTREPHLRPEFGEAAQRISGEDEIEALLNRWARAQFQRLANEEDEAKIALMSAAARAGALGGEGAGVSGDVFGAGIRIEEARAAAEQQVLGNLAMLQAQFEHDIDLAELNADIQRQLIEMQEPGFLESAVNLGLGVASVVSLFKDTPKPAETTQVDLTAQPVSTAPAESTAVAVPQTKTGQAVQEFARETTSIGTAPTPGAPLAFRESLDRLGRGLETTGAMNLPTENPESFWHPANRQAVAAGIAQAAKPDVNGNSSIDDEGWRRLRELGLAEHVLGADGDVAWFVIDDPALIALAPPGQIGEAYRLTVNGPAKKVHQETGGVISEAIRRALLEVRRWSDGSVVDLTGGQ